MGLIQPQSKTNYTIIGGLASLVTGVAAFLGVGTRIDMKQAERLKPGEPITKVASSDAFDSKYKEFMAKRAEELKLLAESQEVTKRVIAMRSQGKHEDASALQKLMDEKIRNSDLGIHDNGSDDISRVSTKMSMERARHVQETILGKGLDTLQGLATEVTSPHKANRDRSMAIG